MDMLIGGHWVSKDERREVRCPYDGSLTDTVPVADENDVRTAVDAAAEASQVMRRMPAYERARLLRRAAELLGECQAELAELLTGEVGKTIREARVEASRPPVIFELCAEEARRIGGEVIPYGAAEGTENRRGFCRRVPCGVVSAITPFNFPLALSSHKVAPALAAGNSVVLKPTSKTPLAVLTMARCVEEAGFPPGALNVVTAGGADSEPMITDPRVRVITFTGSAEVGELITRKAGIKRLHLELGSNSAVTVMSDADLEAAMPRLVQGPFAVAGQVCISVQKILVHQPIYREFLGRYVAEVARLTVGDPRDEATDVGPMIDAREAERAMSWVEEALDAGGQALCGASHEGALMQPTVLVEVPWQEKVCSQEIFAPVVVVQPVADLDEAIEYTNNSRYGLMAGLFTSNVNDALRFADEVETGGVNINDISFWRADFQPYGGVKDSGIGREGVKFAIEEMTEWQVVAFKLPG